MARLLNLIKLHNSLRDTFVDCFSAGFHHVVIDHNLIFLQQNLQIETILSRLLKNNQVEQNILSIKDTKQRIQMFIEWLQWRPHDDYKYFIRLLYKTNQAPVAAQLLKSCMYIRFLNHVPV